MTKTRKHQVAKQWIADNLWHREMGESVLACSRYVDFIYDYLGDDPFALITINLNASNVKRYIHSHDIGTISENSRNRYPFAIGEAFYKSILNFGIDTSAAYQTLIDKYLLELNKRLLGRRFTRFRHPLKAFAILENEGKGYDTSRVTHIHLFIQIPFGNKDLDDIATYRRFIETAATLFADQVYVPFGKTSIAQYTARMIDKEMNDDLVEAPARTSKATALDIRICKPRHPTYVMKQLPTFDIAANRFYLPLFAGRSGSKAKTHDPLPGGLVAA